MKKSLKKGAHLWLGLVGKTSRYSFSSLFSLFFFCGKLPSARFKIATTARANWRPAILNAASTAFGDFLPSLFFFFGLKLVVHCGSEQPRIQTEVPGHTPVCSPVFSHQSLICLFRTACFACALCYAPLRPFVRSLTHSLIDFFVFLSVLDYSELVVALLLSIKLCETIRLGEPIVDSSWAWTW